MKNDLAIYGRKPVREKALPLAAPYFDKSDEDAVAERIRATFVIGDGPKGKEFEVAFAKYLGVKHAILTTSCTAALDLAFMVLDFNEGEAIVPDYTFSSTALAPILNGLKVRLCDVEYGTATINPDEIKKHITKDTRAIVPIDYAGHPCRIEEINKIAAENNLVIVHDAAQSCGTKLNGRFIGSQAPITCFSFHATKNLVTGEGGCLVTNDDNLAEKAMVMREKGTSRNAVINGVKHSGYWKYEHEAKGNSYVQSDILAALALSQLKKLDWMNGERAKHAAYLNDGLKNIPGLILPVISPEVETNWHIYAIRVPEEKLLQIKDALNAEGIAADMHYRPLHQHSYYRSLLQNFKDEDFPNATRVSKTLLRLPMYPGLSKEDLDDIINAVKKVFGNL